MYDYTSSSNEEDSQLLQTLTVTVATPAEIPIVGISTCLRKNWQGGCLETPCTNMGRETQDVGLDVHHPYWNSRKAKQESRIGQLLLDLLLRKGDRKVCPVFCFQMMRLTWLEAPEKRTDVTFLLYCQSSHGTLIQPQ